MNELLKINLDENQEPVVSGRELHKVLEVNSNYTTWFNKEFINEKEALKGFLFCIFNIIFTTFNRYFTNYTYIFRYIFFVLFNRYFCFF